MRLLKQSTAITYRAGPFLDDTDGKTAETGLSIAQGDIQISKAGGAFAQTSEGSPTTTHDADGWYQCPLTTTDTGTLGLLTVQIAMSGALPVWDHFMVVPANVYDSLVGGSDYLQTDVVQMLGVKYAFTGQIQAVSADTPSTGINRITIQDPGLDSDAADQFNASAFFLIDRSQQYVLEAYTIGDYDFSNLYVYCDEGAITPTTDMDYMLVFSPKASPDAGDDLDVPTLESNIAAILADTNELQTDDYPTTLSTIEGKIDTIDGIVDNILVDTGTTLQNDITAILADTNELQTDDYPTTLAAILADTNELQTDNIPGTLSTIEGKIDTADTVVDAIKAVTDALTAAAAAKMAACAAGVITGTVTAGTLTTTSCSTDLSGYTADQLINRTLTFTSAGVDGEQTTISDFVVTNGVLTYDELTVAPTEGAVFVIT